MGNQNTFYRLRLGIGHRGHSSQVTRLLYWAARPKANRSLEACVMKPSRTAGIMIDGD